MIMLLHRQMALRMGRISSENAGEFSYELQARRGEQAVRDALLNEQSCNGYVKTYPYNTGRVMLARFRDTSDKLNRVLKSFWAAAASAIINRISAGKKEPILSSRVGNFQ